MQEPQQAPERGQLELSYPVGDFAQYCDDGRNQQTAAAPQQPSLRDRARAAQERPQQQQTNDRSNER